MTSGDALAALEAVADLVNGDEALRLIARLGRRLVPADGAEGATITRREAGSLDDCAEIYMPIPQWLTAQHQARGVWLRAPSLRVLMLAEREATIRDAKTGERQVDEWRQVAEVVARCIVRPQVTVDTLLDWNAQVVYAIFNRAHLLADIPGELLAAELAREAGFAPPPAATPSARQRPPPVAAPGVARPEPAGDDVGNPDSPGAGAADQRGDEPPDGGRRAA